MLNMFKQKSNHNYKTATIMKPDRTQYAFKYKRVTAEDIQKIPISTRS